MAEQAYAYVTLIPVAQGFQRAIAKEMGGVNNVGKKAGQDLGSGMKGGFGKAFRGIAALAGGALAGAGITNFLRESVTAASDLNESLNAVSVSYGDATEGIIALGETAANRLGLSQNSFNAIATQFSGFASNIAGEGGDVVGFIDELSTRGADFASVFNLEVGDALGLFQSGLAGETEPLRKFGIDLSAATVEAYAYANGIGEVGKPLTEAQKQQARYGALLEQTDKVQGDFANTSDSLANAQRILGANFENVQATVGGPLLNAFANLTTALIPVVNELGPVLVDVMGELSPVIADLAGQIPGLLTSLFPLIPVLGDLATVFLDLVAELLPVFVELFTAFLPIITELVPVVASFVTDAMALLVPILLNFVDLLLPIVDALLPILLELVTMLAPVVTSLVEAMLPLIELLLPIFVDLLLILMPILVAVAEIIGTLLVWSIGVFVDSVDFAAEKLGAFSEYFQDVWNGIKAIFQNVINGLIGGFEGFVNGAVKGINRIIDALNALSFKIPDWVPRFGGKKFSLSLRKISEISLPRVALAKGGLVTGPTNALIGEAGPELVIPLDRFEKMMASGQGRTVNYYAAPNASFDAEQELQLAMRRARLLA